MTFKVAKLSFSSSALKIKKGDISQWFVDSFSDAIVNLANGECLDVVVATERAAGPELLEAWYRVPEVGFGISCPTGEARITPNSLSLAKANNIQYIAFPAISCGSYGYPCEEAATIAISTVKEFASDFKEVHFVLFTDDLNSIWLKKAKELLSFSS